MSELGEKLYVYLKSLDKSSIERVDCISNVSGITADNLDEILNELLNDGKVEILEKYFSKPIRVIE